MCFWSYPKPLLLPRIYESVWLSFISPKKIMAADMVVPEHSLHQLDHKDLALDAAVGFVVEKNYLHRPGD